MSNPTPLEAIPNDPKNPTRTTSKDIQLGLMGETWFTDAMTLCREDFMQIVKKRFPKSLPSSYRMVANCMAVRRNRRAEQLLDIIFAGKPQ